METTDRRETNLVAVILAAGRGTRMGPYTADRPKCLLEVGPGETLLGLQLDRLFESGIRRVVVVAGWRADRIEAFLAARARRRAVEVAYNPFFDVANNLHSLWLARHHLRDGGLVVNGDDLFHEGIVPRVLGAPGDIAVTVNRKPAYDADDMKVELSGARLTRIGKDIPLARAHGEAIGLIRLSRTGASWLDGALEALVRAGDRSAFYLRAFQRLIDEGRPVSAADITGLPWAEVDEPRDLRAARARLGEFLPQRARAFARAHAHAA